MGFDRRFTLGLIGWGGALALALVLFIAAIHAPGLVVARLIAGGVVLASGVGLWRHVNRTNAVIARFVETLRHRDFGSRFDARGGAGFDRLGAALNEAMRDLQRERDVAARETSFLEALLDDAPVALLTVDVEHGVRAANKAARRLFPDHEGKRAADFARYGATFAARLAEPGRGGAELMLLDLPTGRARAIVKSSTIERLGLPVTAISVEPVQGTLDAIEVAAQTDLVRVLTHEILNSLTPVTSLSTTAAALLEADPPDLPAARTALVTASRRAEGLRRFVDSYRAVSRPLEPRRRAFAAAPFAAELARLFAAEWPAHPLALEVDPDLMLDADPDLLAQALINLLRNAAQATQEAAVAPRLRLSMHRRGGHALIEVEDNGPGIPAPLQGDIFLPFFTTRREGTGIGLNLVRQIVVAFGWSIEVRGADPGTRISIRTG